MKKRGRPPKVREAVAAVVESVVTPSVAQEVIARSEAIEKAQAYALRIWNGQSPDLPLHERLAYVKAGLEGQGMSMEGVILP